jgi:predicted HTH domain antitoxin
MPVVGRVGGYRFFFYSNENDEPPHVHVQRERKLAKFWLGAVSLAESKRFAAHELREVERIVVERNVQFMEAWHEFFGS